MDPSFDSPRLNPGSVYTNYETAIAALNYNSRTGELLWKAELPSAGAATPATYMVNGKQYVLIATGGEGGGGQFRGATGGIYVAYSLP